MTHTTKRRRQWHPTPVLLPGESHGWRSLVGCCLWSRTELDSQAGILEWVAISLKLQYFGHLMRRVDSLEKTLMLGGIGGGPSRAGACSMSSDCPGDSVHSSMGSALGFLPVPPPAVNCRETQSVCDRFSRLCLHDQEHTQPGT